MTPRLLKITLLLLLINQSLQVYPQNKELPADPRMEWWREARFGMFIHWGLYAVPAGVWNGKTEYGEWIRNSAEIPLETYDHFREQFNPEKFNTDEWVKLARDAGMKYIVITAKHHDGFCMFDTKQTGFNIMNTPFHHDPMKDLSAACRKYGIKFCFYYSIMDWHHPDYLPRREWEKDRTTKGAEFQRYVEYMKAQLKELLTNYGDIGILWFDGEWESNWNGKLGKEIYEYCRTLQPGIIINNRVSAEDLSFNGKEGEERSGGDYKTPEQKIPEAGLPGEDWETCMTMNGHWGYNKNDKQFKSAGDILRMLSDIVSKGGNYLLNVGPTAEGLIPPESIERMQAIGKWMRPNGEAISGTEGTLFTPFSWGNITWRSIPGGSRLYMHILHPPASRKFFLSGCLNEPVKVTFLDTENTAVLKCLQKKDGILVSYKGILSDSVNTVIALDLKGKPEICKPPRFKPEVGEFVDTVDVELISSTDNASVHYTLDGKKPSVRSPLYTGPFPLAVTSTVSARCFRNDYAIGGIARMQYIKTVPLPSLSLIDVTKDKLSLSPGLESWYFEGDWDSIPDFGKLPVMKKDVTPDFSLAPKSTDDHYGFRFRGVIIIPETDVFTFYTSSDDGSALYIDGKKVVDNDGPHGMTEKQGHIALKQGFHRIMVDYFEKTGNDELRVSWSSEEIEKEKIPGDILFH